jgi:excisionase family DNA binding protein
MSAENPFQTIIERFDRIEKLLNDIRSNTPKTVDPPDRCNLDDACQITGLSKPAIYRLTHLKQIPFAKYGARLVFSRRLLAAWIERHTLTPEHLKDEAIGKLSDAARKNLER